MKKRMMKAIRNLNAYIDDDRQKLSDRCHDLELSRKRLMRLLDLSFNALKKYNTLPAEYIVGLMVRIDRELSYPYLRVNWKTKGGKNV